MVYPNLEAKRNQKVTGFGRISRVIVAACLIWFISIGITSDNEAIGFGLALALVLAFWMATTLIQMALCVRFSQRRTGVQSFQIGTIFLVMSYIAIYLVPVRYVVLEVVGRQQSLSWSHWMAIGISVTVACTILSVLQLYVAEAIVAALVAVQKRWRPKNR